MCLAFSYFCFAFCLTRFYCFCGCLEVVGRFGGGFWQVVGRFGGGLGVVFGMFWRKLWGDASKGKTLRKLGLRMK